jgi:hypothetical protein
MASSLPLKGSPMSGSQGSEERAIPLKDLSKEYWDQYNEGQKRRRLLVDRDCAYLDGKCNCPDPSMDCKYVKTNPFHGGKIPLDGKDKPMGPVKVAPSNNKKELKEDF